MASKWYDLCKRNYPTPWGINRIRAACEAGRITPEEFEDITGQPYAPNED